MLVICLYGWKGVKLVWGATPSKATPKKTRTQQWRAEGATCEISKSKKHSCQTSLNRHKNISG